MLRNNNRNVMEINFLKSKGWKMVGRTLITISVRPTSAERIIEQFEQNVQGDIKCPHCKQSVHIKYPDILFINSFLMDLKEKMRINNENVHEINPAKRLEA